MFTSDITVHNAVHDVEAYFWVFAHIGVAQVESAERNWNLVPYLH